MNNYFCVLPFYAKEFKTPETTPCCLLPIGTDVEQVKRDMLDGQRSTACGKCWHLEDRGVKSDRQIKNEIFDFYADKDIDAVESECNQGNYSTRIVKLHTSNLCNSSCVTCNGLASSLWANIRKDDGSYLLNETQERIRRLKPDDSAGNKVWSAHLAWLEGKVQEKETYINFVPKSVFEDINYKDLVMLSFVGGEPLLEKKNFQALEQLLAHNNTNCFISLVSNGSVELTADQKHILSQFKNVNICLSIDGIEERFEYMRHPLKWSVLLDNIKLFRELNYILSVSYLVSNVNVLYYKETVAWFNSQKLPYNHNMVFDPPYFSPYALPIEVKNSIDISSIPKVQGERDLANFRLAIEELQEQDRLKNISLKDYMPEFYNIVKRYQV